MLMAGSNSTACAEEIATSAPSLTAIAPIQASMPYTAGELMAKLLDVAALPEDKLTRENVENVFGIQYPNREKTYTKITLQGQPLNTRLIFNQAVGEAEFSLSLSYDHDPSEGYRGREYESRLKAFCISQGKFMTALENQGWRNFRYTSEHDEGFWFVRGPTGAINLDFARPYGCLWAISISRGERFNRTRDLQQVK